MANTPSTAVRVSAELAAAARRGIGRPDLPLSTLVRAGLAVLAGTPPSEALEAAHVPMGRRPGRKDAGTR
jgi:hypothetical protein